MDERLRILLVEDDVVDQMAFARFTAERNVPYDVRKTGSLAEFRGAFAPGRFDAVVTDYELPDGTALDVIAESMGCPVVVVTGAGNERIAVEAMKAGARDYLIKDHDRNYLHVMPVTVRNAIDRRRMELEREQLVEELKQALADIKTLKGLIPICARCKKIRDDKGFWNQLERYIQEHSEAQFTHGYCPECANVLFGIADE